MTTFVQNGNSFKVIPDGALDLKPELPAGTYTINVNPMTGEYSLIAIPNIEVKTKIYGNTENRAFRILNTFKDRPSSTGVLLVGRKGTGKTMLSKLVSQRAREHMTIPTIIINEPHSGEDFNRFISDITQPCIVIFDEFEKVYKKNQEELLTLFDGVYPTKKLFVVTSNSEHNINEFMWNRPGRIFYRFNYEGIPDEEVQEYLKDTLNNKDPEYLQKVFDSTQLVDELSYDILKAIVEDLNRYPKESIKDTFEILNIDVQSEEFRWEVTAIKSENPAIQSCVGKTTGNNYYNILEEDTLLSYMDEPSPEELKRFANRSETMPAVLPRQIFIKPENIVDYNGKFCSMYHPETKTSVTLKKIVEKPKTKFQFFGAF